MACVAVDRLLWSTQRLLILALEKEDVQTCTFAVLRKFPHIVPTLVDLLFEPPRPIEYIHFEFVPSPQYLLASQKYLARFYPARTENKFRHGGLERPLLDDVLTELLLQDLRGPGEGEVINC